MKRFSIAILIVSLICVSVPLSSVDAKAEIVLEEIYQDEDLAPTFTKIAWDQKDTYVLIGYFYDDLYERNFPVFYTSNDGGENWEKYIPSFGERPEGYYVLGFVSLFWDGQRFIAVDGSGTILASDENGLNWEVVAKPSLEIAYWWDSMYRVDDKYIGSAVTMVLKQRDPIVRSQRQGALYESEDLINWQYIKLEVEEGVDARPYYSFYSYARNDESMVYGGDFSRLAYTKDGKWFEKILFNEHPYEHPEHEAYKGDIRAIIWNGEEFILALNRKREEKPTVIHSSKDGVFWDQTSEIAVYDTNGLVDTEFGTIAFGTAKYPLRFIGFSTDHKEWVIKTLEEEKTIRDVLWNGTELIAVGSSMYHVKIPPALYYHDFEEGKYWSEDMLWAIENELVSGYKENGKYFMKPSKTLTEAETVTILYRYFEPDEMASTAPKSNWWASVPYQLAEEDGLDTVASYHDHSGSNDEITRGKLAQLLASKHFGKHVSMEEAVQFMYDANITAGYPDQEGNHPKNFESYGAETILERAHIVSFIKRYHEHIGKLNGHLNDLDESEEN